MCIYLRLFLGMGIIWYFEILAFALTSYKLNANIFILTDTLNMCQVNLPCSPLIAFSGCVGVHHLRVQEERDQGVARKVKQAVQHRQADVPTDVKSVSTF